jgi:hypothetical protein
MKLTIIRKDNVHTMNNVKSIHVTRKGWLFPKMRVDVKYKEDVTVKHHYTKKDGDMFWDVDSSTSPSMGSWGVLEILVQEEES